MKSRHCRKAIVPAVGVSILVFLMNSYITFTQNDNNRMPYKHIGQRPLFSTDVVDKGHEPRTPNGSSLHHIPENVLKSINSPPPHRPITAHHLDSNLLLTTEPYGRLGNVMFQYAGLLGVARVNHRTPFIPPSSSLTRIFKVTHVQAVAGFSKWKHLGEPNYAKYDATFESLPRQNLVLQAYLQSFRYFSEISNEIRKEFTFLDTISKSADDMIKETLPYPGSPVITVGVHVRRGDKLTAKEVRLGEKLPSKSYFQKAMDWMRQKHHNVLFLATTDDTRWAKSNIAGADLMFLPAAPPEVHMAALSRCNHVIMSVGTFGWWAGWFSGGDVIYYDTPVRPDSAKGGMFSVEDVYPAQWVGMGD